MDITNASLTALYVKYSQIFQQAFLRYGIYWPKFAQLFNSTTTTETHVWADRIPMLRQWIGDRIIQNVSLRTYSLTNLPFELTVGLDEFNVRDNKINAFSPTVQMLAQQSKKWGDTLFYGIQSGTANAGAIVAGASTTTYDGVAFWSGAHPVNTDAGAAGPLGSQSNLATATPLTTAAYFEARQTMRDFLGADGLPLNVNPSLLMVPTASEAAAIQILQTQWTAPAAAVGQNAAAVVQQNAMYGTADLLVTPDMGVITEVGGNTGTPWILMDPSGPVKPFLFQLLEAPQFFFEVKPDSPSIISRHQIQVGVRTRGIGVYGPYFYAYLGIG